MKKPKALKVGSTIAIAAASSTFSSERFREGVKVLKEMGFRIKFNENILKRKSGYLAGSDDVRANELNKFFSDPDVDAIMFARGGYGVQRIIPRLDFTAFKKRPKLIVGYSDLTALISLVTSGLETTCLYGPVVTSLADADRKTISSLNDALTSHDPLGCLSLKGLKVIKEGTASGRLKGGCLTMISTSIGTPYKLKTENSILFLEDVNERIYEYDRMLTHLANSGLLKKVSGIIFGSMGLVKKESRTKLLKIISEILSGFKGPVVYGLKAGHIRPFMTLPLGVKCRLVAKSSSGASEKSGLFFEEAALTA